MKSLSIRLAKSAACSRKARPLAARSFIGPGWRGLDKRARFDPEPQRQLRLSFLAASQAGDMAALTSLLVESAVSWSDGGGKVQTNLKPIHGKLAVARFWLSVTCKNQRPLTETLAQINGSPALLFWDEGSLAGVISLRLCAVGIQEIYARLYPEKRAYLQKQLSGRGTVPDGNCAARNCKRRGVVSSKDICR